MPCEINDKAVAVVVGAGAVGLAAAWRLAEAGYAVIVVAERPGVECVSGGAGAIWEYPPFQIEPQSEAKEWVLASYGVFKRLSTRPAITGSRMRRVGYFHTEPGFKVPPGAEQVDGFHFWNASPEHPQQNLPERSRAERPPPGVGGCFASGYWYTAPVVHMPTYLGYLESALRGIGVCFVSHTVTDLRTPLPEGRPNLPSRVDLVVNCTGLGASKLTGDTALFPVRGVLVRVRVPPGVECEEVVNDETRPPPHLAYIVPQRDGLVALAGSSEAGRWELTVSEAEKESIVSRCERLYPSLKGAKVEGTWAGLRPARKGGCRLELVAAATPGPDVIHNYGHGGSGVVTSWGCADATQALALRAARLRGLKLTGGGERALLPMPPRL
eukprot:Hpha_TRINITY_DN17579_c0_g1::TRINITY_DN17579_c0_g1_i1::g.92432::m.92432/K00273/DAO, aao; D-amino-acid oxidase